MWIYIIRNQVNGKLYVGQTKHSDPHKRWRDHLGKLRAGRQQHLYRAMMHYGVENFSFMPLEMWSSLEELDEAEMFWISYLRSWDSSVGYNMTLGGAQPRVTDDVRLKLSELNTGERNPFFGRRHTEDAKRAIGKASRGNTYAAGVKPTEEQRVKKSDGLRRCWADPEFRKRLSDKQLIAQKKVNRHKLTLEDVKQVLMLLEQGKKPEEVATVFNVSRAMIYAVKKGTYKCYTIVS